MKVIKHGKYYDDGAPFLGTCYCGCKVEVLRKEIKYVSDQRDGDYHYVKCPECSANIYITDTRLSGSGYDHFRR